MPDDETYSSAVEFAMNVSTMRLLLNEDHVNCAPRVKENRGTHTCPRAGLDSTGKLVVMAGIFEIEREGI